MPGEDGYSLIRRLRAGAVPACASTPAAALTAFAREEDRQLALRAGFQMHLAKPVDPAALVAAVASLGQAARSSGSTASLKLSCPA
jgi:CheY-like chemotaxis protein